MDETATKQGPFGCFEHTVFGHLQGLSYPQLHPGWRGSTSGSARQRRSLHSPQFKLAVVKKQFDAMHAVPSGATNVSARVKQDKLVFQLDPETSFNAALSGCVITRALRNTNGIGSFERVAEAV